MARGSEDGEDSHGVLEVPEVLLVPAIHGVPGNNR